MIETSPSPSRDILESPAFLPFLPMLYIAWADGDLTAEELKNFQDSATLGDLLSADSKTHILSWLNADHPPTSADLLSLLRRIRQVAKGMEDWERESLVTFGLSLCRFECEDTSHYWQEAANLRALAELETSLGLDSHDALFEILGNQKPPKMDTLALSMEPDPQFDVEILRKILDGRHRDTIESVRTMLQAPMFRFFPEENKEQSRQRVLTWVKLLADRGVGRLAYPEVFKSTPDLGAFMATFETLAYFDLSLVVKTGVQFGLFGGAIYFLGTDEQRQKWLPDVASGQLLGCFAMSELGHGSNVRDLGTQATFDPETDSWIIHTPREDARKEWIWWRSQ